MGRTSHLATRGTTHRNGRKPGREKNEASSVKDCEVRLPPNSLVVFAANQDIVDRLEADDAVRAVVPIYVKESDSSEPEPYCGYIIDEQMAASLCLDYRDDLCACGDKWLGPLVLGRVTSGNHVRPLHRTELPVEVPHQQMTG